MALQTIDRIDLKTKTKQTLLEHIHSMDLTQDNKLPREEQLCQMLGVSRVTLRSALNELAAEGVVLRKQGKGTFVNRTCIGMTAPINPAMHFGDIITRSGYTPHIKMLGWQVFPATPELAAALEIPEATSCIRVQKIFYADAQPCVYCEDILPAAVWGDAPIPNTEDSLFQLIYERCGRKVAWDKMELHVCTSDHLPDLYAFGEHYPLLVMNSIIYDTDNVPLFYSSEYIDTKLLTLSQIRQREFSYTAPQNEG